MASVQKETQPGSGCCCLKQTWTLDKTNYFLFQDSAYEVSYAYERNMNEYEQNSKFKLKNAF